MDETARALELAARADRSRAHRIRKGTQSAVDVPIPALRTLISASAASRQAAMEALGVRTVEALVPTKDEDEDEDEDVTAA